MHNHTPLLPLSLPTCAHTVSITQTTDISVHQARAGTGSKGKSGTDAAQLH